jgi:uncharacterized protein (TIGR03067 family)
MRCFRLFACLVSFLALFSFSSGQPEAKSDATKVNSLDGIWQISALIDDGEVLSPKLINERMARDGRLTISGQKIAFTKPGTGEKKEMLFITNPKAQPATIDLGGSDKTSGLGIYAQAGDTLMVCLSGPGNAARPTDFSSRDGGNHLLMTLKRLPATEPPRQVVPAKSTVTPEDVSKKLVGTWGHQDSNVIEYITFNSDGTFSVVKNWKRVFRKIFDSQDRSSGTWKVNGETVIMNVTASTESNVQGQVYSYRINTISPTDVVYFDQQGNVRREWRVR